MKLINPKFAVTACLFALLAAPAVVFADRRGDKGEGEGRDRGRDKHKHQPPYAVPEPSTLIMTLAGMGIGIGVVAAGVRCNRRRTVTA
jgi:hypothetical protein